jgi:thiamine biosynthesis protein ThiS
MQLVVNGAEYVHQGDGTLAALLSELGAKPAQVALMLNGRVLTRAERNGVKLQQGDTVEVLTIAAGG